MFILRPWINPILFQSGLFLLGGGLGDSSGDPPFRTALQPGFDSPRGHGRVGAVPTLPPARRAGRSVYTRWRSWPGLGNLLAFFPGHAGRAPRPGVRRRFLRRCSTSPSCLCVVSVVQYFSWDGKIFWFFPTYDGRALGPFLNRDQYAAFIDMLLAPGPGADVSWGIAIAALRGRWLPPLYASVIAGASRAGAPV